MKTLFEKKVNKLLIGAVLGTAILGFGGLSMSPKGKKFNKKLIEKMKKWGMFFRDGVKEMVKTYKNGK